MNIIDNINKNQIDYLKSLGMSIINFKVTYNSEKSIVYNIDISLDNKEIHVVVSYNWDLFKSGIQIYKNNKLKTNKSSGIFCLDDLNVFVDECILRNIY